MLLASSLVDFLENDGKIKIVCSPFLSIEDARAIQEGVVSTSTVTKESLIKELLACDVGFEAPVISSLLRNLTAIGAIDFRIAVSLSRPGIYHPKIGIFTDHLSNCISFNGSINETFMGWSDAGNFESFNVFKSWESPQSVIEHQMEFEDAWYGKYDGIKVYSSSELHEVFEPRAEDMSLDECFEHLKIWREGRKKRKSDSQGEIGNGIELEPHQKEVLKNWNEKGRRGIVQFMTGGGKTITGIFAAREWLLAEKPVLILVPTGILHDYWSAEFKRILPSIKVIKVGNNSRKEVWQQLFKGAFGANKKSEPIVFISTYQSAKTIDFLSLLKDTQDLLLIADEVHNLGASDTSKIMDAIDCPARLGLSATFIRQRDEDGTNKLVSYFENELEPIFTFEDALKANRLVPYQYKLETVVMTEEEQDKFDELTRSMMNAYRWVNGKAVSTPSSEHFARQRANVIKESSAKDDVAIQILQREAHANVRFLVYCNSRNHLDKLSERLDSAGLRYVKYHSKMLENHKNRTLEFFEDIGGIMLSIKCLDEGVDIPRLDKALILASSTSTREYIQRRGRALRKSPGKNFAYIHDVIVLRDDETPALISEVTRGQTMALNASNKSVSILLTELMERWIIKHGHKEDLNFEIEEYDNLEL